jgi:uncharacterized protein (TIGR02271 family)
MPDVSELARWTGRDLVSSDGDKIGKIQDIYLDQETGKPEWLAVKTGLFGGGVSFVPLAEATDEGEDVRVPYDKYRVKDAPHADADGELSQDEEATLYRHYGLDYTESRADSGLPEGGSGTQDTRDRDTVDRDGDAVGTVGHDTSGPTTDDAMTRSEEELRVGTTRREAGRARLKKYVVTENVETTVPVQREEVRLEREPIIDANVDRATSGPEISDEEHEVTLHAEEAIVDKQVVPKERVRLDKDVVTDERQVSEEVRKEQVDLDDPGTGR